MQIFSRLSTRILVPALPQLEHLCHRQKYVGKPSETDSVKSQISSKASLGKTDSTKRHHQRHHQRQPGNWHTGNISAAVANLSSCSLAFIIIFSRKMLKRVGVLPYSVCCLNYSPVLPYTRNALITLSWSCSIVRTRIALILYFRMVAHKATCHTLLKAFLKSMKS